MQLNLQMKPKEKQTTFNFEDPKTKERFYFPEYTISIKGEEKIYKYKGKQIINEKTKNVLVFIDKPVDGWPMAKMKFANSSPSERSAILKKRSKEHSKRYIPNDKDL